VFGDRDTGAYLPKPSWTDIVRHTLVKGGASPDDPDLAEYWRSVAVRSNPHWMPTPCACCPGSRGGAPCAEKTCSSPTSHPSPPWLGTVVPVGDEEGDQGGLPGPPQRTQRAAR